MNSPRVSVIVPCAHAEAYLGDIVDDILRQTEANWELIVVGNGPDQSAQQQVIAEFAARDSRVAYYSLSEAGVSRARNFGMTKARGEWIAFVDADDRIDAGFLSRLLSAVSSEAELVVGGIGFLNTDSGRKLIDDLPIPSATLFSREPSEFLPLILKNGAALYSPCGKLFRTSFLVAAGVRFEESLTVYEDGVFCLELYSRCKVLALVRQSGYLYCSHGTSTALGRYHATMSESLSLRRELLTRVWQRAGIAAAEIEDKTEAQYAADVLDIFLNAFRRGTPLSTFAKIGLTRELFRDKRLSSALDKAAPSLTGNAPLAIFRMLFKLRSAALCVAVFSVLFVLRNFKR